MKRIWLVVFITLLVIFVLLDLLLEGESGPAAFAWLRLAGFFALFGFIGSIAIVAVAKLIGHYWLQRKEDYYDKDGDNE